MIDASFLKEAFAAGSGLSDIKAPVGIRPHFVVPDGYTVSRASDDFLLSPWRLAQAITVFDPKSFIDYFTDYCLPESRVFVDVQKPTIVGVLDYHKPPVQDGDNTSQWNTATPAWVSHRVAYQFRQTKEWSSWIEKNGIPMKQIDFARFIEQNLVDIVHPAHAEMLQVSRTMEAKKNVNFSSGVRLQNGEVQLTYQEEIRGTAASGTIEIPEIFKISISPFEGTDPVVIDCRFRYEIRENALNLRYEMVRPHKVIEAIINKVVSLIQSGITNPVTFGSL